MNRSWSDGVSPFAGPGRDPIGMIHRQRFRKRRDARHGRDGERRLASGRARSGFTLVELMIVISLIGVIVSIAVPSLQSYVWRARRNEAFLNLNGIYKAQMTYQIENGRYGSTFDDIGFEIEGSTRIDANTIQSQYYTYTIEALTVDGVANANFSAVATGDLDPSDAMLDIIMIESGVIIND